MKSKIKKLSQNVKNIIFLDTVILKQKNTDPLINKNIEKKDSIENLIGKLFTDHRKIPLLIKNPFLEIIKQRIIDGK